MSAITKLIRRTLFKTLGHRIGYTFSKKITLYRSAKRKFAENQPQHGSLRDYRKALLRHFVSYNEYMMYQFYEKTEEQRNEYFSDSALSSYALAMPIDLQEKFHDKILFLKNFSQYIHRKWIFVPESTFEEFVEFSKVGRCFSKTTHGTQGKGVNLLDFSKYDSEEKLRALYQQFNDDKILLEEIVVGNKEMQSFHPQSLNTIRLTTIAGKNGPIVLYAGLRIGVDGNVVDNTHSGNVYTMIDVETGITDTEGIDKSGNSIAEHPNSKIPFKGFKIPDWEKIKQTCLEAQMKYPDIYIVGWDVVLNANGQVELIEGNNIPSLIIQSIRGGIKQKLIELIPGLFHIK